MYPSNILEISDFMHSNQSTNKMAANESHTKLKIHDV